MTAYHPLDTVSTMDAQQLQYRLDAASITRLSNALAWRMTLRVILTDCTV